MTKRKLVDATVTLFCLFGAYWLHINTFINWDVAGHIKGAKRLLLGGDYTTNVFDGNSPFVFAFFIPVIRLATFSYSHKTGQFNLYLPLSHQHYPINFMLSDD